MAESRKPQRRKRTFDHPEYKLQRKLGEGGMATVYLAKQVKLDRPVALKIMSSRISQNEAFKKRFMREARTLAQFRHPNIITIYEVEAFADRWFIVMEYLDSGDLKSVMTRGLTKVQALKVTRQICEALQYAHERNYVHRDIKPENILFDQGGRLVLTDFGIARSLDTGETQLTQAGVSVGTPAYMAPEQFESSQVDHRADLYSLGILLFQMLSGEKPFQADSAAAMLFKHATEDIPTLPESVADLQPLVNALMAKKAEDRPEDARAVIAAIDQILGQTDDTPSHQALLQADSEPSPLKDSTIHISTGGPDTPPATPDIRTQAAVKSPARIRLRWGVAAGVMLMLLAGVVWWLSGGHELAQQPKLAGPTVVEAAKPKASSNPFDAVAETTPQDFFVGRAANGQVVVEVDSAGELVAVFSALREFDRREDVGIDARISAWQFFSQHFADRNIRSEVVSLALNRAEGWQEVLAYEEIIRAGDTDPMNFYYRGYGYQMAGRYEQAITDYNRAIALDPSNDFVVMFRQRAEELQQMEKSLLEMP